jgi:hypothetical protein
MFLWLSFSTDADSQFVVTCAMPMRLAGIAVGSGHMAVRGSRSALSVPAAKSAHRVSSVAPFILLADICDQRLWTLHLNFEGGDQRVFRVNDNVSRFPLNFKTDHELHLRALLTSAKCSTLR